MQTFNFNFETVDVVKEFIHILSTYECSVDVQSGRYIVDGKSVLGLLSLDLSKTVIIKMCGPQAKDAYLELATVFPNKVREIAA